LKSTAAQLAEKYGVSEKTVKRDAAFAQVIDRIVDEYGAPNVKRMLLGADVRLTQGTARALLRMPPEKRKKAVDDLIEQGELLRGKKGPKPGRKPKEVAQSLSVRRRAHPAFPASLDQTSHHGAARSSWLTSWP
jgi:hypothetical protein